MKTSGIELILFTMALVAVAMFVVAFALPTEAIAATTGADQGSPTFDRYPGVPNLTAPQNFPWGHMPVLPQQARPTRIPPPFEIPDPIPPFPPVR